DQSTPNKTPRATRGIVRGEWPQHPSSGPSPPGSPGQQPTANHATEGSPNTQRGNGRILGDQLSSRFLRGLGGSHSSGLSTAATLVSHGICRSVAMSRSITSVV